MPLAGAGRNPVRRALAVLLFLVSVGDGGRTADGYRFLHNRERGPFVYGMGEEWKQPWRPSVWGPGMMMEVVVPDDPRWMELSGSFRSMDDVRRWVGRALADWSATEGADIRWTLGDPAAPTGQGVSVRLSEVDTGRGGHAQIAQERGEGPPGETVRCRVVLNGLGDFSDRERSTTLLHELGHCLTLDHHPPHPNARLLGLPPSDRTSMWGTSGVMSVREYETPVYRQISRTERVGASVSRPAPGWRDRSGAVYGTVLASGDGEGLGRMVVLMARLEPDGRPRTPVTRMTNEWGQFGIEGLEPGSYVVMVFGRTPDDYDWQGFLPIRETLLLDPVEVRAGERTGPLVLTARRDPVGE